MTEVFKGAVIGAVDAGAKAAGLDSETETAAAASKAPKTAGSRSSKSNRKTGKGK